MSWSLFCFVYWAYILEKKRMEKEIVKLFAAAKRAAESAAALNGGAAEESRCIDALSQLKDFPITYQLLVSTQVGKQVRCLTKHPRKKIQAFACELLQMWKNQVIRMKNVRKVEDKKCVRFQPETAKLVYGNGKEEQRKLVTVTADENNSTDKSLDRTKPCMINSNDELRDKVREQIYESLCKVLSEAVAGDEVNGCDPIRVAVSVESAMFVGWGKLNGSKKMRYRSTLFNIKDQNNPDFRRKILLGQVRPEGIISMTAEEMASDRRKLENQQLKEKALLNCQRMDAPTATTDQFMCSQCGSRKTTYSQMQTRSADKPVTIYVTCTNCNNRWTFC